jgi:hypothetical protein
MFSYASFSLPQKINGKNCASEKTESTESVGEVWGKSDESVEVWKYGSMGESPEVTSNQ